jgi:hypothetical protein
MAHPEEQFLRTQVQPIRLTPFPQTPVVRICRDQRLVLAVDQEKLKLFRLGKADVDGDAVETPPESAAYKSCGSDVSAEPLGVKSEPEFLLELTCRGRSPVVCADISLDGNYIATCDNERVHIYQLQVTYFYASSSSH